ncbi:Fatty acid-binding protein 2, liver [Armadillidium nasatum]|uniref:Fatty acid-binding protein 2, liver n=1 Tax=Armadillidium nasatum TaxID=96803 RepID=A0A5N5T1W0_9CRUS|nr:Fatty acid-binding protein 2, liver [Armadillidium nasatum]
MSVNGSYALEKNENVEAFLKALGFNDERINKFVSNKPTITLTHSGNTLEIVSKGNDETKNTLTLGSPSNYTLASGFELEVNLTISGNTGKGTLKKGTNTGEITIEFGDNGITETFSIGGNSCKRTYKRV